eukprot:CAMPEP_0198131348 /NCGR_PEP_ID=MMETSP1442-20131203/56004_1 /TAXON_ID= /ORGANISM="Craspedostauros australis, Strain CCMP3328" /LENGTH=56 /DNA_ID=CAMNT_0043792147 /DNA_START=34 /DNA_END=201 /DNA_ORIENTATION=+
MPRITLRLMWAQARWKAVSPSLFWILSSTTTPYDWMKESTTLACPFLQARWKGVSP